MTLVVTFQTEIPLSLQRETITITPEWLAKARTILAIIPSPFYVQTLVACFDLLKFQIYTLTCTQHIYMQIRFQHDHMTITLWGKCVLYMYFLEQVFPPLVSLSGCRNQIWNIKEQLLGEDRNQEGQEQRDTMGSSVPGSVLDLLHGSCLDWTGLLHRAPDLDWETVCERTLWDASLHLLPCCVWGRSSLVYIVFIRTCRTNFSSLGPSTKNLTSVLHNCLIFIL